MINFHCPRCNRDMALPDEQRGQYAFCKLCEGRVWIPPDAPLLQSQQAQSPSVARNPPELDLSPVAGPVATPPDPVPELPTSKRSGASIPEPPKPVAASAAPPTQRLNTNAPTASSQNNVNDAKTATRLSPPPTPKEGQPQHSSRHHATLITAEPAQSPLAAASDGQLPALALETDDRGDSKQPSAVESNRWLTLGVVCISLLFSTVLLLVETDSSNNSQAETKDQILLRIQERYFGPENGPWLRYESYLRDAALARSQGDNQKEQRYYRKVLHLLNAQHLDKTDQGITGLRRRTSDSSLKSDEELMELISRLLKTNN